MAVRWDGPLSVLQPNLPSSYDLVGLGVVDTKGEFHFAGFVFAPSKDQLIADFLEEGEIRFANGRSYDGLAY